MNNPWTDVEPPRRIFTGDVAVVTGAASGIGKACVEAFLARGAKVAGLDISPGIVRSFDNPDFQGIAADVSDENSIRAALAQVVEKHGRIDILVLNAGIFPVSHRIEELALADWDKVMRVNLDGNLVLLRDAHVSLKAAPRGGRVVIIGSRNVPAPGIGAAAYSASKAGLTQLARVAALEWGKDGIRVNIIHPDSVFDTGIWTEEVLASRAANYGLTVEQYKKRNVLQVEIQSKDVAELVAEMCGPLFAKITGAQVSLDGGNDRVI